MEARRLWIILTLVLAIFCLIGLTAYALYLKLIDVPFATTSILVALVSGLVLQAFALVGSRTAISRQVRTALNQHYSRLNQNVFIRLQSPQFLPRVSTSTTPFYRMEFSWDITDIKSSYFWADAEKHINKDIPEFLPTFRNIEDRARKYNQDFEAFRASEQSSITRSITGIANVGDILTEETILRTNVISMIEDTLLGFQVLNSEQLQGSLDHLWKSQLRIGRRDKDWYFGAYTVCRFATQEKVDQLRDSVDRYLRDPSIRQQLAEFFHVKTGLENDARSIMARISQIVFLIEDDRYTTEVECCKQVKRAYTR